MLSFFRVSEVRVKQSAAVNEQPAAPVTLPVTFPVTLPAPAQHLQVFDLEGQMFELLVNQGPSTSLGKGIIFFFFC